MGLHQIEVELLDHWPRSGGYNAGDRDIAHAAWASSYDHDSLQARSDDEVDRVVRSIVKNAHDTPKEGVWMKFFMRVPIFIERQFDKYRMTVQAQDFRIEWYEGSFGRLGVTQNELSGRYRTIPERPYKLPEDVRKILGEAQKERSEGEAFDGDACATLSTAADRYSQLLARQHDKYQRVLESVPQEWRSPKHPNNWKYKRVREVFRGLLGTSFMTDMRIVMNLNAFEHIVNQRLAADAQMESRVVAYQMVNQALHRMVAPEALDTMVEKNGWQPLMEQVGWAMEAESSDDEEGDKSEGV